MAEHARMLFRARHHRPCGGPAFALVGTLTLGGCDKADLIAFDTPDAPAGSGRADARHSPATRPDAAPRPGDALPRPLDGASGAMPDAAPAPASDDAQRLVDAPTGEPHPPKDAAESPPPPGDALSRADAATIRLDAAAADARVLADGRHDAALDASLDASVDATVDAAPDRFIRPAPVDAFAGDLLGDPMPPAIGPPRVVILMIGDGMGPSHLEAARSYLGRSLRMESMPFHGKIVSSSFDGVTDSAAAATAMGSGVPTDNHFLGLDRDGRLVEVGVEMAHRLGARAGLVTTVSVPHATPAGFASHVRNRFDYIHIAESMVRVAPEVMLGGGQQYFRPMGLGSLRSDTGLIAPLEAAGYTYVETREAMMAATPDGRGRLMGLFAPDHLAYVLDRVEGTPEPTLAEMTAKALEVLAPAPGGFFLMVEGGKIDLASHANQIQRAVPEVIAFDEAVGVALDWVAGRGNTALLVTADHETGELGVTEDRGPGVLPGVRWRRGNHSNRLVDVFARGPACAVFDRSILPNRWIHAAIDSGLSGEPIVRPAEYLLPDGRTDDLVRIARQRRETDFGVGFNQLDALGAGVDAEGLNVGVEGLFQRGLNAVSILIDVDFGAATGLTTTGGVVTDLTGRTDVLLSNLRWDAAAIPGLGFDRAVVIVGATDVQREARNGDAGLRGLSPLENLPWFGAPVVFGEAVRPDALALAPSPGEGLETNLTFRDLFGAAGFPRGARVALFVTLSNADGTFLSNQTFPPLSANLPGPGGNSAAVPGVIVLNLDTDLDGEPDELPTIELIEPVGAPPP